MPKVSLKGGAEMPKLSLKGGAEMPKPSLKGGAEMPKLSLKGGAEIQKLEKDDEMPLRHAMEPKVSTRDAQPLRVPTETDMSRQPKPMRAAPVVADVARHTEPMRAPTEDDMSRQPKPMRAAPAVADIAREMEPMRAPTETDMSRQPKPMRAAPAVADIAREMEPMRAPAEDNIGRHPDPMRAPAAADVERYPEPMRVLTEAAMSREDQSLPIGKTQIKSPNYPSKYPLNKTSTWNFRPKTGTASLTIKCSNFTLEDSTNCKWDYLMINGKKFCGTNAPNITANWLKIEFKSDAYVNARGFMCEIDVRDGCCGRSGAGNRIVGGAEISPAHSLPWQVGLMLPQYNTFIFCGGSVLNSRFVITAAHCTAGKSASGIRVAVGAHDRRNMASTRIIPVKQIHQHSEYNSQTFNKDISLLELAEEITFSDKVRPVCLPRGNDAYADVDALVSGWGTLKSGGSQPMVLYSVNVRTITNSKCAQAYGSSITQNMLCAAAQGKDSCQGDSGGPLVNRVGGRATQIGVVSFGKGCADPNYPGVYVRVTEMMNWIDTKSMNGQVC